MTEDRPKPPGLPPRADHEAHLRLLVTSDLHMHVYPHDYVADRPDDRFGLARLAPLIRRARAEAANSLTFDNGDFLQGTPMGDHLARGGAWNAGDTHPYVAAMNAVGYDAGTIGNHEFNYGLEFLTRAMRAADFPVVLSNVLCAQADTDETLFPPYVILDRQILDGAGRRQPIRIGVIGFAPPQVLQWDRKHLCGRVEARGIVETARALVPRLKAEGAELVVALAHTGIAPETGPGTLENAGLPLAAIDGIDAVLAGHSHLVFPSELFAEVPGADTGAGTLHGKAAVMPGFGGSHLGVVDLLLTRTGGAWRVAAGRSEARPVARSDDAPAADVMAPVEAAHRATLAHIRRQVGRTLQPLHSYFSMLQDTAAVRLVAEAQMRHVREALRGTEWAALPLVSAAAPYKAGGRGGPEHYIDIPAGAVAMRHVADLYSFPNEICALCITGATLRAWLERSAAAFNRIAPGARDAPLLSPDFPSHNFDMLYGLRYDIDVTRPARFAPDGSLLDHRAGRIVDLRHGGRPVRDDMAFIVATNCFRASAVIADFGGEPVFASSVFNRDVLMRHIADNSPVATSPGPGWRIAPQPNTSAVFATGPGARAHARASGLRLDELGMNEDGFLQYRLTL
ncbi:bifunctional 2',3'-cyclic-nucleotide 2'-phosphodiesterase/3'-nucleotidase [Aestuariicoccus sp. MJ-SS9]|uniref:bifunctional 2',3'-cyclic-nucleotide 2'-phosphodiesterase/3'-nucleotidase n=1 Tax=Aestuariicoccus sp. MJ-SS9 TaxID=3079855 RepID=UPI002909045F|nr:bifunctional 2',3'-cyclic-nucleotide 2'-phosphodiesterase/3'-nucleotidase [Aestuariicoccus sp. MJ-SS9]MDU8910444.1 bifunctional 2',3'-cyclic-nucleotide 2'-phosphodiesterase/3'-nucleotidase [Aestuariicoccus sp. MJ-SS9]